MKIWLSEGEVEVDLDGDNYGLDFWQRIGERKYEPDTIGFIEDNCDSTSDFMDIGAANGAMTLIAAIKGSRVLAYEPIPKMFEILQRNVNLNPKLVNQINVSNKAISSNKGTLNFSIGSDPSILSEIIFTGLDTMALKTIKVLSLSQEIDKFHRDLNRRLIIKMDIEGAEWRILKSDEILRKLQQHQATIILAVHPGFYRPFKKRLRGFDRIRLLLWHFQNYLDSRKVFHGLKDYAVIRRTNLNPITRGHQFGTLIYAGYHEFVLEFRKDIS